MVSCRLAGSVVNFADRKSGHYRTFYAVPMQPFDLIAAEYQRVHSTNPHQVALVDDLAGRLAPGSAVLDLGCGTGVPTAGRLVVAGHAVTGVDTSSAMLALARTQVAGAEFVQGDMG